MSRVIYSDEGERGVLMSDEEIENMVDDERAEATARLAGEVHQALADVVYEITRHANNCADRIQNGKIQCELREQTVDALIAALAVVNARRHG